MRITHIQIDTGNAQIDSVDHPLTSTLNAIYTDGEDASDLSSQIHSILINAFNDNDAAGKQNNAVKAQIRIEHGGKTLDLHLINEKGNFNGWSMSNCREERKNDPSTPATPWTNICHHANNILGSYKNTDLLSLIESYETFSSLPLWEADGADQENSAPQLHAQLKHSGDSGCLTLHRHRFLLTARVLEIEQEIAERTKHQQNLPSLLSRRNHLNKRLSEPAPASRLMTDNRRSELNQQLQTLQIQFTGLRKEQSLGQQQLANLELDLHQCCQGANHRIRNQRNVSGEEYQQLCASRDRVIRDLAKLDRQVSVVESTVKSITRKLDRHAAASGANDPSHVAYRQEQQAITEEIKRITKQIQSLERINWLEDNHRKLSKQLEDVIKTQIESRHRLIDRATHWLRKLSRLDGSKIRLQETHKASGISPAAEYQWPRGWTVLTNNQPEAQAPKKIRELTHLAFRMAAEESVQTSATSVPLILQLTGSNLSNPGISPRKTQETPTELNASQDESKADEPLQETKILDRQIVETLVEYSKQGAQVIVLTDKPELVKIIQSAGGGIQHVSSRTTQNPLQIKTTNAESNPVVFPSLSNKISGNEDNTVKENEAGRIAISERMHLKTKIEKIDLLSPELKKQLADHEITTVGAFIQVTDDCLSELSNHCRDELEMMFNARSICDLICNTSKLNLFDAKLLIGAGIQSTAELHSCTPQEIMIRTESFLLTPNGQACLSKGTSLELCRLLTWLAAAHLGNHPESPSILKNSSSLTDKTKGRPSIADGSNSNHYEPELSDLKIKVPDDDDITDTVVIGSVHQDDPAKPSKYPTISPETDLTNCLVIEPIFAKRFQDVGYLTAKQFIDASPLILADELGTPKLHPKTVATWQEQISLLITIPGLKVGEARLLVFSGFSSPESIASTTSEILANSLKKFSKSTRGKRQTRDTEVPSINKISNWILDCKVSVEQKAA